MSQPRIGVGVLIFRDGKLLLGKRKGSHGAGHWSAPGGIWSSAKRRSSVRHVKRRKSAD